MAAIKVCMRVGNGNQKYHLCNRDFALGVRGPGDRLLGKAMSCYHFYGAKPRLFHVDYVTRICNVGLPPIFTSLIQYPMNTIMFMLSLMKGLIYLWAIWAPSFSNCWCKIVVDFYVGTKWCRLSIANAVGLRLFLQPHIPLVPMDVQNSLLLLWHAPFHSIGDHFPELLICVTDVPACCCEALGEIFYPKLRDALLSGHVSWTVSLNSCSPLKQCFFVPLHRSKYYLMYTFKAVHVVGILQTRHIPAAVPPYTIFCLHPNVQAEACLKFSSWQSIGLRKLPWSVARNLGVPTKSWVLQRFCMTLEDPKHQCFFNTCWIAPKFGAPQFYSPYSILGNLCDNSSSIDMLSSHKR